MFSNFLYSLIILPIEFVIEFVFCFVLDKFESFGVVGAIVAVSLVVNFLALPIYNVADEIQLKERNLQKKMAPFVKHIKAHFKGDEQFMILSGYYRLNNYHPIFALRQSLSVLIQLPFFIAAYHFLSNCSLLENQSFMFLKDLSKPDATISFMIGGGANSLTLNILPILMTLINVVSSIIYTKSAPLREKIQANILPFIFLVILYNSPSGLVFYWILNNIFSLCKNALKNIPNQKKILNIAFAIMFICLSEFVFLDKIHSNIFVRLLLYVFVVLMCSMPVLKKCWRERQRFISFINGLPIRIQTISRALFVLLCICLIIFNGYYCVFKPDSNNVKKVLLFLFTILFSFLPLWTKWLLNFKPNWKFEYDKKQLFVMFFLSCLSFALLCGFLLPSNVIVTDPEKFSFLDNTDSPLEYVWSSLIFFLGLFAFWPLCVYKLFSENKIIKVLMPLLFFVLLLCAMANAFLFKYNYGTLNVFFKLDNPDVLDDKSIIYSVLPPFFCLIVVIALFYFIKRRKLYINIFLLLSLIFVEIVFSVSNMKKITSVYLEYKTEKYGNLSTFEPDFHFSKDKENVIVLCLDRAISSFFPYIMEQFPELKNSYDGFVYYPNCLSFADFTNCASPAMMGGYDYSIDEINKRDKELLKDKHNEAILVLPKIFDEAGFETTISNAQYIDYNSKIIPELFDFLNLKKSNWNLIKKYRENYIRESNNMSDATVNAAIKHFCIMQILHPTLRRTFSNHSQYYFLRSNRIINDAFVNAYAQLFYLGDNVLFDSDKPTYTFIHNFTSHEYTMLQAPDYTPGIINDDNPAAGTGSYPYTEEYDFTAYHSNVAAHLQVAKFLKKLKDEGIYDNTRIIIVADHGRDIKIPAFKDFENWDDAAYMNPLLLFKDFNSHGEPVTDNVLKTNAETVYLATQNLPVSHKNPFTGKDIKSAKDFDSFNVYGIREWRVSEYKGKTRFPLKNKTAYTVRDNIFDENNWTRIDTSEAAE